jgi:iron complex outermembrane receptor protein
MRSLLHTLRGLTLGALMILTAHAAEPAKKNYDLPAGEAAVRLKQFSETSGRETLFAAEAVRGVRTAVVKGEFTPKEALDRMLDGTGLVAVQDEKTGALAVRRDPGPNAPGAAQTNSDRPTDQSKVEDGKLVLDKYEVSGRKIDGLINKSLLPTEEGSAVYFERIERAEIERLGVTNIEELFRFLPQSTTGENSLQSAPNNVNVTGGTVSNISRVGLGGFPQSQTVILINGRLQPRAGTFNTSGTDISRIPIAAIERVEILPMSGSALYGAGALGGAINIILRRDYQARNLSTYIGTSWEGGGTEARITYLEGRTANLLGRKLQLTTTIDYQHRDAITQSQRPFLDRVLEKYGPNTTIVGPTGISAFETFTLPAFAGSPPILLVNSTTPTDNLGIPGKPGVRWVQLPAGISAAQAAGLTPDALAAQVGKFTPGNRYGRSNIYTPTDTFNLGLQAEYELTPKITAYSELSYINYRSQYAFAQGLALNLSATDPLNPFRTGVTPGFVGKAVRVFFDPLDIPPPDVTEKRITARAVFGLRGKLGEDWEWSVDTSGDYNGTYTYSNNRVNNLGTLLTRGAPGGAAIGTSTINGVSVPNNPAPLDVRRAIYPVLADHNVFPISQADAEKYFQSIRDSRSFTRNVVNIAKLTGPVYALPAGEARVAMTGEHTYYYRKGGQFSTGTSNDLNLLNTGYPFSGGQLDGYSAATDRESFAGIIETTVPVFGRKWRPLWVEGLDLNASYRRQRDTSNNAIDAPTEIINTKYSSVGVYAAKLQIVPDLFVRFSYSGGFYPPDWNDFGQAVVPFLNFQTGPDAARGNTSQPLGTYEVINGGSVNLLPESAIARNWGIGFSPRWLKGFLLTIDYRKITKLNSIQRISAITMITRPDDFPTRIVRAPLSPADAALGYTGGLLVSVDQTPVNVGILYADYIDTQLRYNLETKAAGSFVFSANTTFTNKFTSQQFPGRPFINTAGSGGPIRWRGRGSVTWLKDRWTTTLTALYSGHYSTSTTAPTEALLTAFPYDGGRIPASMRYDFQASYQLPARSDGKAWENWISGTKYTLGVQNILNEAPALVSNGTSFYDRQADPRMRYLYVQISKDF